jgi:hypothetical protein
MRLMLAAAAGLIVCTPAARVQGQPAAPPASPLVLVVGCAQKGPQPHVWRLTNVGERSVAQQPAVSSEEQAAVSGRPLGSDTYDLVGIADFVAPEVSVQIGHRGDILTADRANATGALAPGHKVAVKGLYIAGKPGRINVTSVVDLAPSCP